MHVDSFIVCPFSFIMVKFKKKKKFKKFKKKIRPEARGASGVLIRSDDGWTNIKHYENVNDQI